MKPIYRVIASVIAMAFASGTALAQTAPAVKEDKAQLKADEAALAREKAQLKACQRKQKADNKK